MTDEGGSGAEALGPPGEEGTVTHIATRTGGALAVPGPAAQPWQTFPVSKLRGLTLPVRAALRRRGIATCERRLWLAARSEPRAKRSSGQDFPGLI
jgi:hypothetical protein